MFYILHGLRVKIDTIKLLGVSMKTKNKHILKLSLLLLAVLISNHASASDNPVDILNALLPKTFYKGSNTQGACELHIKKNLEGLSLILSNAKNEVVTKNISPDSTFKYNVARKNLIQRSVLESSDDFFKAEDIRTLEINSEILNVAIGNYLNKNRRDQMLMIDCDLNLSSF